MNRTYLRIKYLASNWFLRNPALFVGYFAVVSRWCVPSSHKEPAEYVSRNFGDCSLVIFHAPGSIGMRCAHTCATVVLHIHNKHQDKLLFKPAETRFAHLSMLCRTFGAQNRERTWRRTTTKGPLSHNMTDNHIRLLQSLRGR